MASDNSGQRSFDPRRKEYNPDYSQKRVASQSPVGGPTPKKQATREGSSTPLQNSSRQSSVSNGPTRPPLPGSRRSPPFDGRQTSNHATLLPVTNETTSRPVAAMPSMAPNHGNGASVDAAASNPVLDMLMSFSNQVTQLSMMQMAKKQKSARLQTVMKEYDSMKSHFDSFPAIKEQKLTAKKIAESEFRAVEEQLSAQMDSHQSLVESMASMLQQPAESKSLVGSGQRTNEQMALEGRPLDHATDSYVTQLEKRLAAVEHKNETWWNSQNESFIKRLEKLERVSESDSSRADLSEPMTKSKDPADWAYDRLKKQVEKIEHNLNIITAFTMADDNEKLDQSPHGSDSLAKKIRMVEIEIRTLKSEVKEEGKESVVKRLKNLDRHVNNLSSQVIGDGTQTLQGRLSQLECDQKALLDDVEATKEQIKSAQSAAAATATASASSQTSLQNRLSKLERDMKSFNDDVDAINATTLEAFDPILQRLSKLETEKAEDIRLMDGTFTEIKSSLEASKAQIAALEDANTQQKSVNESIPELRASIEKAEKSLLEKVNDDVVAGMKQELEALKAASPHVRTLRQSDGPFASPNHSPIVNGMHGNQQAVGSTPASKNGSPNPSAGWLQDINNEMGKMRQDVRNVNDKHDALTYVTQRLQQQYNNITTDEVCQAMLNQLGNVWPHALNYNESVKKLTSRVEEVGQIANEGSNTATQANTAAESARAFAMGAAGDVEQFRKNLGNVETLAKSANKTATASSDAIADLKKRVSELQENVTRRSPGSDGLDLNGLSNISQTEIQKFNDQIIAVGKKAQQAYDLAAASDGAPGQSKAAVTKEEIRELHDKLEDLAEKVEAKSAIVTEHRELLAATTPEFQQLQRDVENLTDRLLEIKATTNQLQVKYLY